MQGAVESELARLMRAAIAGDEKAYGAFLRRAGGVVHGFVRRKVERAGIDAEDVVQETLLAIHVKRHTWRSDSPVLPWLYAIARYKLIDAFRRRGRRMEIAIDEALACTAPEAGKPGEREVRRALDALSPGQRAAVTAVSVDGLSIRETAKTRGMSETAVRVALHRGLSALAARFGRN